MRKVFTYLFQQPLFMLRAFFILLCLLGSKAGFTQINPPPVILAPTATTVNSSANPSVAGQGIILTAIVTTQGNIAPTGTVDFYNNTTNTDLTPGGIALSNGSATYHTGALNNNTSITVTYSGDAANLNSTSAAFAQTVNQPPIIIPGAVASYTTLVSDVNPVVAGSPITFTANVSSFGNINVTGKVDFYDQTDQIDLTPGGITLSDGAATFTTSSLLPGDLNIVAGYLGDANNQGSISNTLTQHIVDKETGIVVTVAADNNNNPVDWSYDVKFTATVSAGVGASAGTVAFADGGNLLGYGSLNGSGVATFTTNLLTPGSHNITASYFSITSSVLTLNVNSILPLGKGFGSIFICNVGITSSAKANDVGQDPYGELITFEAYAQGDGTRIPTGNLSFIDSANPQNPILLATVGLDASGSGKFTTSPLSLGSHLIYAIYSGDDSYSPATSAKNGILDHKNVSLSVVAASTQTSISSSLNPSVASQDIMLTATVIPKAPSVGGIGMKGKVTFSIDGVAQTPIPLQTYGNGGKAFFEISSLSPGTHIINAAYTGDGYYGGSTKSFTQTIGAVGSDISNFLGSSQSTAVNTVFPYHIMFDIMNINPAFTNGVPITFTAPSTGPSGTFSNGTNTITVNTSASGSVGIADSGPFTANGIEGPYAVIASIPGMGTNTFTMDNFQKTVQVSVDPSPASLSIIVDGITYSGPQQFDWVSGSSHSIAAPLTQVGVTTGTQYVFANWSDGTNTLSSNNSYIVAPSAATVYTASFRTQYALTVGANPTNGGTVYPVATNAFYDAGTVVPVGATPLGGYHFSDWTGNVANSGQATTTVTMTAPQTVSANFDALSLTTIVTIGTSVPGLSFNVDGTVYTTTQTFGWFPGDIHSISVSTTQAGTAGTQYVFTDWSGSTASSRFVSVFSPTTYTAHFKTQYQLTTISNPQDGGSVTPASASFFDAGSIVSVQANPNSGFLFSGFTHDLGGTGNPQNLTFDAPKSVTATFGGACPIWYKDADNDGYSDGNTQTQCTRPTDYKLVSELKATSGDCDDSDPTVNPGTVWVLDADGDGYYTSTPVIQCASPGNLYVILTTQQAGDCNDNEATINPGTVWVMDSDGDGYYVGDPVTQCSSPGTGYVILTTQVAGDCDDGDPLNTLGHLWYRDNDNDGYSDGIVRIQCTRPAGFKLASELIATSGDCNDGDATINPATVWVLDADGDGYYAGIPVTQCAPPGTGYVILTTQIAGDCDDTNPSITLGLFWYKDNDNDGYSDGIVRIQCTRPAGFKLASELIATSGDCNDGDATINPATVWVLDADGDGYYTGNPVTQCTSPGAGYVVFTTQIAGDCNDNDVNVYTSPSAFNLPTGVATCSGSTATITVSSSAINPIYAWYADAGGQSLLQQSSSSSFITPALSANTIYYVSAADGVPACATALSPVSVTVNPLPSAAITAASMVTAVSTGNTASVSSTDAGAIFNWTITNGTITSAKNVNPITYTAGSSGSVTLNVSVTSSSNCGPVTGTVMIPITALKCPEPRIKVPIAVCSNSTGNTATLTDASGGTNDKYNWTIVNGTPTSGTTGSSVTFTAGAGGKTPFFNSYNFVQISAKVTNASGVCTVSSGTYYVYISPYPTASVNAKASVCSGSTGNTASVANAGIGATYAWAISGGTITSGGNSTSVTYKAGVSGNITLSVTVTSIGGCKTVSPTKTISITALPVGTITASSSVCAGSSGNAASVANAGTGAKYAWSITNGSITSGGTTNSILYKAGSSGSVSLKVTVTNSGGCASQGTKTVTITANTTPTFTAIGTQCKNAKAPTLPLTSNNGIKGTWSPSTVSTANTGTTTYTFTPAPGQCATTTTMKITVQNCAAVSVVSTEAKAGTQEGEDTPMLMDAIAWPSPTESSFSLMVKGKRTEVAEIRIFDILGRAMDTKRAATGEIVRFGETYKQGIYIIEVVQGNERKVLKVVKQ